MNWSISIDYNQAVHKAQLLWDAAEDYQAMIASLRKISTGNLAGSVPMHLDFKLETIIQQMEKTRLVMIRCGNNIFETAEAIKAADEKAAEINASISSNGGGGGSRGGSGDGGAGGR